MTRKDIIRWVIERMMAHDDSITQELALQVEIEARREWGGQRIDYIAKTPSGDPKRTEGLSKGRRPPVPEHVERAAVADYLANQPIDEVSERHGIHRRTLYYILKRRGLE